MNKLLLAAALWAGLFGLGWARTVEQQLLASLRSQGYVILEQSYTFLGRLRVVAENGEMRREILVNPGTGEILRDDAVKLPDAAHSYQTHGSGNAEAAPADPAPDSGDAAPVEVEAVPSDTPDDPAVAPLDDAAAEVGAEPEPVAAEVQPEGGVEPDVLPVEPILPFAADGQ